MTIKTCEWCGQDFQPSPKTKRNPRTCSIRCRTDLRIKEHGPRRGAVRREYEPELIERVRKLYTSGMSQLEVQAAIGGGCNIELVMKRAGIERRPVHKNIKPKDGENNPAWKGDDAGYAAAHRRLHRARGHANNCVQCGSSSDPNIRYEWANLTGNYMDIADYDPMCVPCHRAYDGERRRRTGTLTRPEGFK